MKKSRFTWSDLQKSKVASLNQGALESLKRPEKKKGGAFPKGPCLQVQWMWSNLAWWSISTGIEVVREYKFHPERKWRFDFFIKHLNCAVEYEGIFSEKSRHTSKVGFSGDVEKYREAATMGITVLRYTARDFKNVLKDINKLYERE